MAKSKTFVLNKQKMGGFTKPLRDPVECDVQNSE